MRAPAEMSYDECLARLREETVGRVAVCTPSGPRIVPVTYVVDRDAVVVDTAAFSVLGTQGAGAWVAFEVDRLDRDTHTGWSVIAIGRAALVDDPSDVTRLAGQGSPPRSDGGRHLHLRITWRDLAGQRFGA